MKKSKLQAKILILVLLSILLWSLTGYINTDSSTYGDNLFNQKSSPLMQAYKDINEYITKYAQTGIVGIAVLDLTTKEYFSINSKIEFNPASVIKVPIMVEAYHQVAQGKITLEDMVILEQNNHMPGYGHLYFSPTGSKHSVRSLIDKMITDSDNTATNMLIHYLGMAQINRYMSSIGLSKTVLKDETLLCKIPPQINSTCPDDMLKLLEMMYDGKLVSKTASREMLGIMLAQKHKWGIPRLLPEDLRIANKTGSVDGVRNDVAIVFARNKPYIITIFSKQLPSNNQGTVFVRHLSKLIYDKMTGNNIHISLFPGRGNQG